PPGGVRRRGARPGRGGGRPQPGPARQRHAGAARAHPAAVGAAGPGAPRRAGHRRPHVGRVGDRARRDPRVAGGRRGRAARPRPRRRRRPARRGRGSPGGLGPGRGVLRPRARDRGRRRHVRHRTRTVPRLPERGGTGRARGRGPPVSRTVRGVAPRPRRGEGGPWLVADVGGTNARFALVDGPDGVPYRARSLPTRDHAGLAEAAAAYLGRHARDVRPSAACLAVAGPVTGGTFRLTNAGWPKGTPEEVRAHLGVPHLEIVNDFEALALALPRLGEDDLVPVGGRRPSADGTVAVVGPGTGLGVAGLVPTPSGWVPLPGEGGQVDVPAATDRELEVARLLRAEHGSATAELLLSGGGLSRLHRYLAALDGAAAEPL